MGCENKLDRQACPQCKIENRGIFLGNGEVKPQQVGQGEGDGKQPQVQEPDQQSAIIELQFHTALPKPEAMATTPVFLAAITICFTDAATYFTCFSVIPGYKGSERIRG